MEQSLDVARGEAWPLAAHPLASDDGPAAAPPASWAEARARFAQILGVQGELPEAVLRRAMVDQTFAYRLMISRNAPKFLAALINDPGNARYEPPPQPGVTSDDASPDGASSFALLGKAARSLARWGAAGFSHVSDDTFKRRLEACSACPHLTHPPDRLAYRLVGANRAERSACGKCGCLVHTKARMSTEACPVEHPERTGFTRWNEPVT
jgi:hypothetical protein